MPLPIYAFFAIIVLACAYFNIIPNQMIGAGRRPVRLRHPDR